MLSIKITDTNTSVQQSFAFSDEKIISFKALTMGERLLVRMVRMQLGMMDCMMGLGMLFKSEQNQMKMTKNHTHRNRVVKQTKIFFSNF